MKTKREIQPMSKTTLRLPENLIERAKIRAIKERRTFQEIATTALEAYLKTPLAREGEKS
jgi:predicted DNA binding CopG/RHH family protein